MNKTELIETMAKAIYLWGCEDFPSEWMMLPNTYKAELHDQAKAALSAIEDAGFVVVPKEPTEGLLQTFDDTLLRMIAGPIYKAMIAVKKNINEEEAVDELISIIKENGDWREPPEI